MAHKKHWIELLEEVGRPMERRANHIKNLHAEIADKRKEIEQLEREINEAEYEARQAAKTDWSEDEINKAEKQGADFTSYISREDFMAFYRSDEYNEQLSSDDCEEVFRTAMKGSSDFSAELLEEILSDYEVEGIEIYKGTCRNGKPIDECDCC